MSKSKNQAKLNLEETSSCQTEALSSDGTVLKGLPSQLGALMAATQVNVGGRGSLGNRLYVFEFYC